jgi:hypothetical protein
MSQALAKLPPKVANAVRDSLAAAPGPKTQHSLIQLFGAPKMIELAKAGDEAACTQSGADAVLAIADWAKSFGSTHGAREDRAAVDAQESTDLDGMRSRLTTIDVKNIDKAIEELSCARRGTGTTCDSQLFPPPSCDDDTTSTDNGCASTTTCAFNDVPDVRQEHDRAQAAESKLASIFRELDTVRPSRAMQGEWNLLRDRYRTSLNQSARATIQAARRGGSATLARDGHAQRRFDEGGRMVDAFVRANIAFNADAMNLVHAAVASKDLGRIRTAGQEASAVAAAAVHTCPAPPSRARRTMSSPRCALAAASPLRSSPRCSISA